MSEEGFQEIERRRKILDQIVLDEEVHFLRLVEKQLRIFLPNDEGVRLFILSSIRMGRMYGQYEGISQMQESNADAVRALRGVAAEIQALHEDMTVLAERFRPETS